MGALLQAIFQGAGRAGNELTEAKNANQQEKQKQAENALKLEQFKAQMQELQQKLSMNKAPQFVGTHADPKGQIFNTQRDPLTGKLSDTPGGQEQPKESWTPVLDANGNYVAFDKTTGSTRQLELNGNPVKGVPKGKSGPLTVDGKPVGVWRGGQPLTPDSPEWTAGDAVQLSRYLAGYTEAETNKNERVKLAAQSRAWAWLQMPIGVYDADTSSMTEATREQVSKNPGRYGPPGPAEKIVNQRRLFREIDATSGVVNDAISKLPNDAFDANARAQVALVLRDEQPRAAWYEFVNSSAANTLSKEQVEYVTGLVSLQESAMSLRTLAGMGQGSDQMRAAIIKMLPGAGTPSKYYAMRQMQLFKVEVDALRSAIPSIGSPERGEINKDAGGVVPKAAGPKRGEVKEYQGRKYEFDGKQWVQK